MKADIGPKSFYDQAAIVSRGVGSLLGECFRTGGGTGTLWARGNFGTGSGCGAGIQSRWADGLFSSKRGGDERHYPCVAAPGGGLVAAGGGGVLGAVAGYRAGDVAGWVLYDLFVQPAGCCGGKGVGWRVEQPTLSGRRREFVAGGPGGCGLGRAVAAARCGQWRSFCFFAGGDGGWVALFHEAGGGYGAFSSVQECVSKRGIPGACGGGVQCGGQRERCGCRRGGG